MYVQMNWLLNGVELLLWSIAVCGVVLAVDTLSVVTGVSITKLRLTLLLLALSLRLGLRQVKLHH